MPDSNLLPQNSANVHGHSARPTMPGNQQGSGKGSKDLRNLLGVAERMETVVASVGHSIAFIDLKALLLNLLSTKYLSMPKPQQQPANAAQRNSSCEKPTDFRHSHEAD
jgi:hypothetical protein